MNKSAGGANLSSGSSQALRDPSGASHKVREKQPRAWLQVAALVLTALGLAACSSGGSTPSCNSLTCAGCCNSEGRCETGATVNSCGTDGDSCATCDIGDECTGGRCLLPDGGNPDGGSVTPSDGGLLPDGGFPDAGPTTYAIAGTCGPLPVTISSTLLIGGPCDLGAAGDFTLDAGLAIDLGQACGPTVVGIDADWIQNGSTLHSSFTGEGTLPCLPDGGTDFTQPIPFAGMFTYSGGTGSFSDASGSAVADGGITANLTGLTAEFSLKGSLTY